MPNRARVCTRTVGRIRQPWHNHRRFFASLFFHHFFDLNSAVNVQKTIVIPRREKGVAAEAERQRHAESTQRAGDQLTRRGYERKGTIQQPLLREQIKLPGLHTMLLLTTIHHKSSRALQPAPYWTCAVSSTYEKIRFFWVC